MSDVNLKIHDSISIPSIFIIPDKISSATCSEIWIAFQNNVDTVAIWIAIDRFFK